MGTTNILDLNNRIGELEKAVSGGDSAQANKADIATEFSATTAYTAGCFVYYGGKLYQFNADHAAGAWDPTDVVEANVTDQVVSNKAAIDELAESYPADKVMLSDGVTSVEDALDGLTANGLGTRVEITSYTQSNPFTAPSDGYFIVYIQSGVEGFGCVENSNCAIGGNYYDVNSNHTARYGIYVRKGMRLFCTGSPYFAVFIPIS